ncbi:RNA binding protein, heterogenous nuclear RNP-K like protein [Acarospora aff. strigata]|nr:RNA binding protein, heterogenous nuclear RNP-K like protein [Acarospora aff. strigata]
MASADIRNDDTSGLADSVNRMGLNDTGDDNRLGPDGEPAPRTDEEYAQSQLTLRAIVSSKEAGVIIGKAGKNVADLREETGVKAGVSKVVQGVHDRVLTVTGSLEGISKAYAIVAKGLLEGAPQMGMGGVISTNGTHRKSTVSLLKSMKPGINPRLTVSSSVYTSWAPCQTSEGKSLIVAGVSTAVRLLISHNQMGTIIGRQGLKIKHIQDVSGVRMVAQKEMLPQSTERIVEVQGTPDGIQKAVWEIGKCLVDDWQRGTGTVLYNPAVRAEAGRGGSLSTTAGGSGIGGGNRSYNRTGNGTDFSDNTGGSYNRRSNSDAANRGPPMTTEDGEEIQTQNISIPSDMVGCIIGRGGSKISEIRKSSGARISIAKAPHDETGERMFTIMGVASANEKALYLLYENLEAEKMRRSQQPQE